MPTGAWRVLQLRGQCTAWQTSDLPRWRGCPRPCSAACSMAPVPRRVVRDLHSDRRGARVSAGSVWVVCGSCRSPALLSPSVSSMEADCTWRPRVMERRWASICWRPMMMFEGSCMARPAAPARQRSVCCLLRWNVGSAELWPASWPCGSGDRRLWLCKFWRTPNPALGPQLHSMNPDCHESYLQLWDGL